MPKLLRFRELPGRYTICRLAPNAPIPVWAHAGSFLSITRNADELSIVCPTENVPPEVKSSGRWVCCKLEGPFAFSETGILASFLNPLAEDAIPIFAVSTFDTDYVLVQEEFQKAALLSLQRAGHRLLS
jgi:hypothetical protein